MESAGPSPKDVREAFGRRLANRVADVVVQAAIHVQQKSLCSVSMLMRNHAEPPLALGLDPDRAFDWGIYPKQPTGIRALPPAIAQDHGECSRPAEIFNYSRYSSTHRFALEKGRNPEQVNR